MNKEDKIYRDYIDTILSNNEIVVFMKGEKQMPMCGFSHTVTQILDKFNINYLTINVLDDDKLRQEIKLYSEWPTIPQVYINGDFIGGADILLKLYQTNELQELLEKNLNS